LDGLDEAGLVSILGEVPRQWPIIVHPDLITDPLLWKPFGRRLCLENMDQRKPAGRTLPEMEILFEQFPEASFCFDIGHARQVDPTMGIAISLLRRFRDRIRQVHMSEVDPWGRHIPISFAALSAFQLVAKLIPEDCPVILESVVPPEGIRREIATARKALTDNLAIRAASSLSEVPAGL
jgi:hypothetical protein